MDDYKPLTPEQIYEKSRRWENDVAFARAIEQAAIENYLAQQNALIQTVHNAALEDAAQIADIAYPTTENKYYVEYGRKVAKHIAACIRALKSNGFSRDVALEATCEETPQDAQVGKDAELADYKENGLMAVRYASSSAHWSNELRRLFGPNAREGIDLLEKRLREAEGRIEYLARKVCLTGIGDGSAHMHIINLPDAKHSPENGEYKRLFLDTIDAAIAAAKGKE